MIEHKIWWIWMAFGTIFIVAEIFTAGFFLLWFGIGAFIAGTIALVGLGTGWQWGLFIVISLALVMVSRRFADKVSHKQPCGIGAERLIEKEGVVLETVDNVKNTGRVRIEKEEWRAESLTGDIIATGTLVIVCKIEGTHVVVKVKEG